MRPIRIDHAHDCLASITDNDALCNCRKLPPPTEEDLRLKPARLAFVDKYCREKGWDRGSLSRGQIIEIRQQEDWKNPK